jgi:hypothetical protein
MFMVTGKAMAFTAAPIWVKSGCICAAAGVATSVRKRIRLRITTPPQNLDCR